MKNNDAPLIASKIKKNIFCSLLSIFAYYIFDQLFSVIAIIRYLGFRITNFFNISKFLGISLDEYEERLVIIVIFTLMYVVFYSLYDLFFYNDSYFRRDINIHGKLNIRNKGAFVIFILFLFKTFQAIVWFLIIISMGGNRSILETPYLFVATVVGSFILSETLLSSATALIFLSKLIFIK